MRSGGAAHFMDVAWKHAFDTGLYVGPRVFAAGYFLTTTGGHFLTSGHAQECDGPYGFVQAIREQIKHGVDHIKLNLTGGIMGLSWDRHWQSSSSTGARRCLRHPPAPRLQRWPRGEPQTVKAAVRLGARSVEHGYIMDAEASRSSRPDDMVVPTLAISHLTPEQADDVWKKRGVAERNLASDLCRRPTTGRRAPHVVPPGSGGRSQDGPRLGHPPLKDAALLELALWVKDGATPWQALLAATRNAAELCGVGVISAPWRRGSSLTSSWSRPIHSPTSRTFAGPSSSRKDGSSRTSDGAEAFSRSDRQARSASGAGRELGRA